MAFEKTDAWKGYTFKQLTEYVGQEREALNTIFTDNREGDAGLKALSPELIQEIRDRNENLGAANKHWEGLREIDETFQKNKAELQRMNDEPVKSATGFSMAGINPEALSLERRRETALKSLGQSFIESEAYKGNHKNGINARFGYELKGYEFEPNYLGIKTTMTMAAGFAPANDRTDIVVPFATRRPVFQDFIPTTQTDLDTVKFMEETTFTNAAAETTENTAMPESAIAYTERSQPIELVGTFLPITEQQLEIAEAIRGTIDQRLMLMLMLREEGQLLAGNGTPPNIAGFLNKSGIQTQAKGTDSIPDACYKLMTKLRGGSNAGFVEPSLFVFHPNDWQDVRLLKDANGNYIWGNPSEAGPERIWGKSVLVTTAITENTALSGDFQLFSAIWRKRGARIDVGMQNDDFVKNKITLRITSRLALLIYRAAAFGTVTSI